MIKIAICEKERVFGEQLSILLNNQNLEKTDYGILEYANEEDLLKDSSERYDMFCLNIENESKVDVAECIHVKSDSGKLFFISGQKKLLEQILCLAMHRVHQKESKVITLSMGKKYIQLLYEDIIYFEKLDRKLSVVTMKKSYIIDNKINDLDKKLEQHSFFRSHSSFLVNLAHVREYDQRSIIMQNDDEVYISRLKKKAFKESFKAYLAGF